MEEGEDEFGPLYIDVLKPFSSFHQTHNFNDQNPLNFSIQNTNLTTNLKNIDGILVTGGDDCDIVDNLVFDVEKEPKEEEMDSMAFNVERRDHNELHVIGDLKNKYGVLLIGGEDCDIDDNLVLDVETEQKEEEMDSVVFNGEMGQNDLHLIDLKNSDGVFLIGGENDEIADDLVFDLEGEDGEIAYDLVFDLENEQKEEKEMDSMVFNVEKRDHNELHVIRDLMDEQIGDLEIDMGIDNLENNDGICLTGGEDGEIADNLVFDVENEQKEAEMESTGLNVEKRDHIELHAIGDLMDEQIGNLDMGIDDLELGKKISGIYDSTFFDGLLENRENGVDLADLNTNNNCGTGEGFDENGESEDGLTIILNDNLDDYDMEEELGNYSAELVDGKKMKENGEAANGYGELGNEADHLSHAMSKGVRPVSMSEIAPPDHRGTPVQVHPFHHAGHGHGTRLNYQLPYCKTVFDIDIDDFDNKPWRHLGVDVSSFFNFGLDEEKWKNYCKQMESFKLC